ncbi:MAG: TetR/AcrR family transcriptional regulator [Deltaproteobacteria bacterium]|jgi:AcrR family transcriptional regulator|nr:TetR/AcrR family transcriptional regulator [Deltaproteobacteria bacterium]
MSRDEKKAESRRRILESARDVFFRDGFMRANLDEIAEKAGVAKGTLYRYFESKADLYVAVLARNSESFSDQMEAAAADGDSAVERLRSIARFYFQHWLDHPDHFQIFWAIDNESVIGELPREVIEQVASVWEFSLEIVNRVLEEGVATGELVEHDTWELAHVLWSISNALIESDNTRARRQIRRRPLVPLYEHAIDVVIRGILSDPSRIEVPLLPEDQRRPTTPRSSGAS